MSSDLRGIITRRGLEAATALWTLVTLPAAVVADLTLGERDLGDYVSTTSPHPLDDFVDALAIPCVPQTIDARVGMAEDRSYVEVLMDGYVLLVEALCTTVDDPDTYGGKIQKPQMILTRIVSD